MNPAALWMRHGTCDDGLRRPGTHARPGSPLTIAGAVEAELTARELHKHHWHPALIASSPMRRARQTAVIVAGTLDTRLAEPISAFAEWRAPHCVLGRTPSQYPPDYITWRKKHTHNPDSALPGGESLRAFAERALEAATIAHDLATENGLVLIVSHRLLMGAVAALHRSCRHHADIFGYANDFHLVPAHLWAAPPREITWSTIARMSASCRTSRITSRRSAIGSLTCWPLHPFHPRSWSTT